MHFMLPDLQGICPFSPRLNPHFESVAFESRAWIDSFGILSNRQQRGPLSQQHRFSNSALELLAAHAYPYADREGCRTVSDYTNLTSILDDYSDDEGRRGTRVMLDSFVNALRDPSWDDGTEFARISRELRARFDTTTDTATSSNFAP